MYFHAFCNSPFSEMIFLGDNTTKIPQITQQEGEQPVLMAAPLLFYASLIPFM